jgi:hypothetical protein
MGVLLGSVTAAAAGPSGSTTVNGRVIWETVASPYGPGLRTVRHPVPAGINFEAVQGRRGTLVFQRTAPSNGTHRRSQPFQWIRWTLSAAKPLAINGHVYWVPRRDRRMTVLVLPLATGIVWAVETPGWPGASPFQQRDGRFAVRPSLLRGSVPVYYTPYSRHGGSLADRARLIADVPHRWMGRDGPVVASAWSAWLPRGHVRPAHVRGMTIHTLVFGPAPASPIRQDRVSHAAPPAWPTLGARRVGSLGPRSTPLAATVAALVRTKGGFVLTLAIMDPNHGLNAGLDGAAYYWSESQDQWTPLVQVYGVQTLPNLFAVGTTALYWQLALPVAHGPSGSVHVVQVRFTPGTDTIGPVWVGNLAVGPTWVDGDSWIVGTPSDGRRPTWIVYTPG